MKLTDLKKDKEFTVLEISKLFRVTKITVFNWLKRGLVYRNNDNLFLITGKNLNLYLKQFNDRI